MREIEDPLVRFMRLVRMDGAHWIWTGTKSGGHRRYQYPTFRNTTNQYDPKVYAHRWIYERLVGAIPEGHEVDHVCRIRMCVNPEHLEPVTKEENQRRQRLDVCRSGRHDLTVPENVRWDKQGRRRGCQLCKLDAEKRYEAEKRRRPRRTEE